MERKLNCLMLNTDSLHPFSWIDTQGEGRCPIKCLDWIALNYISSFSR